MTLFEATTTCEKTCASSIRNEKAYLRVAIPISCTLHPICSSRPRLALALLPAYRPLTPRPILLAVGFRLLLVDHCSSQPTLASRPGFLAIVHVLRFSSAVVLARGHALTRRPLAHLATRRILATWPGLLAIVLVPVLLGPLTLLTTCRLLARRSDLDWQMRASARNLSQMLLT